MSITVLAIGAMHAAPVVVLGMWTNSRPVVTTTAIVMGLIALATGRGSYAVVDLFFVGIGYFVALAFCRPKKETSPLWLNNGSAVRTEQLKTTPEPEPKPKPALPPVNRWSGVERFETYEMASQYAKELAKLTKRSVSVQEGGDGLWYAGPAQGGLDLDKAFENEVERKFRQEAAKNLTQSYDDDVDVRLMKKEK